MEYALNFPTLKLNTPTWEQATAPTRAQPAASQGGGFLDSVLNIADKAINFVDRTSQKATTVMQRVGQAKAMAKGNTTQLQRTWDTNIRSTPRSQDGDWIPGIPNVALIAAAGGLVLLVLLTRKGNS